MCVSVVCVCARSNHLGKLPRNIRTSQNTKKSLIVDEYKIVKKISYENRIACSHTHTHTHAQKWKTKWPPISHRRRDERNVYSIRLYDAVELMRSFIARIKWNCQKAIWLPWEPKRHQSPTAITDETKIDPALQKHAPTCRRLARIRAYYAYEMDNFFLGNWKCENEKTMPKNR